MRLRTVIVTLGVYLAAGIASAQTQIGSILPLTRGPATLTTTASACTTTTTNSHAVLDIGGYSAVSVEINGTWTGTLQFEVSVRGVTWVPILLASPSTVSSGTSTTANGIFAGGSVGRYLCVRPSVLSSGQPIIMLKATTGGGAGSSSFSGTIGAVTQSGTWSNRLQDGAGAPITSKIAGSEQPLSVAVVDSGGNQISSFGGAGGTSQSDNTSFVYSVSPFTPVGCVYGSSITQITNGNTGAVGCDPYRNMFHTIRDAAGNNRGANVNASNQLSVSVDNTISVGSHAVTNAGTFAVQAASTQSGTWTVQPGNTPNTTAWLVSGTKTNNNAAPGAINFGVLPALANAAAPTWTEGNEVNLSTDLAGALRVGGTITCTNCSGSGVAANEDAASVSGDPGTPALAVRQDTISSSVSTDGDYAFLKLNSVGRLWTTTAIDTALPAGANVIGHVIADSGSTTAVTGNVSAVGNAASAAADSGNPVKVGGVYHASPISLSDGNRSDGQVDVNGYWKVNVAAGSVSNPAAGSTGSAVPSSSDYVGVNVGGTLRGATAANPTGTVYALQVDIASQGGTAIVKDTQVTHDGALTPASTTGTLMFCRASTTTPSAVSADNDGSLVWCTRNGAVVTHNADINTPFLANGLTTSIVTVSASAAVLDGYYCANPGTSAAYVQIFDISGTVTLGTSVPKMTFRIPPNDGAANLSQLAIGFTSAIKVGATTTALGGSAPATALDCNFWSR